MKAPLRTHVASPMTAVDRRSLVSVELGKIDSVADEVEISRLSLKQGFDRSTMGTRPIHETCGA